MGEIKAVLDINVLVSTFIASGGNPHQILKKAWEGSFKLHLCEEILTEARRVLLDYEHIRDRYHYEDRQVMRFLDNLRVVSEMTSNLPQVEVVKEDPDDDKILACALKASADYLISGDPHLKDLGKYEGIEIISPADFLEVLN